MSTINKRKTPAIVKLYSNCATQHVLPRLAIKAWWSLEQLSTGLDFGVQLPWCTTLEISPAGASNRHDSNVGTLCECKTITYHHKGSRVPLNVCCLQVKWNFCDLIVNLISQLVITMSQKSACAPDYSGAAAAQPQLGHLVFLTPHLVFLTPPCFFDPPPCFFDPPPCFFDPPPCLVDPPPCFYSLRFTFLWCFIWGFCRVSCRVWFWYSLGFHLGF